MVIINTNAIEASIHAVSPEFNVGAGAGGGTGAAPGTTASAPNTSAGNSASSPRAIAPYILFLLIFFIIFLPLLKSFFTCFPGADTYHLLQVIDKNFAVADFIGFSRLDDRLYYPIQHLGLDRDLQLHLRQKINDVFRSTI